jgi:hypothetical protein
MRIISHHNHHYIHTGCLVCGNRCELGTVAHDAYDDAGEHLGSVCDACMALPPDEIRATMHAHADTIRAHADDLDSLAEDSLLLERTEGFIHVSTGVPHDDGGTCERCISPQDARAALQQDLAPGDADDEDLPF